MSGSTISTVVHRTITLGSGDYRHNLMVTDSGAVKPRAAGATGIIAPADLFSDSIDNAGQVLGAAGTLNMAGGIGVDFESTGLITNSGLIEGGAGGANETQGSSAGNGGAGLLFAASGTVSNQGTILGGSGGLDQTGSYNSGTGGAGVELSANGRLVNTGMIVGGIGGSDYSQEWNGGMGGAGVLLSGAGQVVNHDTIDGGAGGDGYVAGVGGTGVVLSGGGQLVNHGAIQGGAGGYGYQYGGTGGIGVLIQGASTLVNDATILGGNAGRYGGDYGLPGAGGTGVVLANGGSLVNHGTIEAGAGQNDRFHVASGVLVENGGLVSNTGTIAGANLSGDTGLSFSGTGSILNNGLIVGGVGTTGFYVRYAVPAGSGGTGIALSSGGTLLNHGTISGGIGGSAEYPILGGDGGTGLAASGQTSVQNAGTITGGLGGYGYGSGAGGAGVLLSGGGTLTNTGAGQITGGSASAVPYYTTGTAGGGAGIVISQSVLINKGSIAGGTGAHGGLGLGGNGGAGVVLNGGIVITSGTIAGGAGGLGQGNAGQQGDAVQFGTLAGTLDVVAGAVFSGDIVANTSVDDTLELSGKTGTLSGFGSSVTGFTTITEDAHANWQLDGTISGAGSLQIGHGATMLLDGISSITTIAFGGPGLLGLGDPHSVSSTIAHFGAHDTIDLHGITAQSQSYESGTLTLYDGDGNVVDMLAFSGSYSTANFALQSDQQGGVDVVYAATHGAVDHYSSVAPIHAGHNVAMPAFWSAHS